MTLTSETLTPLPSDDRRCVPGAIFQLIGKVMQDIDPIAKTGKNQQQGYSFRGIDAIYNELHPLLVRHGIFIVPFVVELRREERETRPDQRGNRGALIYTYALIDHRFYAPDGSYITARTIGEAMDSGDKSGNKAQSAAMKYACIEVFAIPTEGDNDTENQSPQAAPRQQQRPPQPAATKDTAKEGGAAAATGMTWHQFCIDAKAIADGRGVSDKAKPALQKFGKSQGIRPIAIPSATLEEALLAMVEDRWDWDDATIRQARQSAA
jgi:hypothetical protein